METGKLVPFSCYLPAEYHAKLKQAAGSRKASAMLRDAIQLLFDQQDTYKSGYNKGIKDATQVVFDCKEAQMVAVKGQDIGVVLANLIKDLEKK